MLVVAATERELAHIRDVDTFVCGVGPVEAALQTARRLADSPPDAVLHIGIAGARGLEPLTVVLGSESVYADVAAAIPVVDRVLPDGVLLARLQATLVDVVVLPIATSAAVNRAVGYDVEAMEGFGVLRACALAGVPAVELRVVSNAPSDSDRATWRFDDAFAALGEAVARVLA